MARRDGTGPLGMGSMTGRGFGPCGRGRFVGRRPRLGLGYGYGRGLGCYSSYEPYPYESYPVDESTERSLIEEEKAILEARLRDINEVLNQTQDKEK